MQKQNGSIRIYSSSGIHLALIRCHSHYIKVDYSSYNLKEAKTQNKLSFHEHISKNLKTVTEVAQGPEELFYYSCL